MVKRKHLAISVSILLHAVCLSKSYAGAYLTAPGNYKYSMSFSSLDYTSNKKRDYRASIFVKIQDMIYKLGAQKEEITRAAKEQNRISTDLEIHRIHSLELDINELERIAKEIATFSDDVMSCFEIEYGITDSQSFGMKIHYTIDKFAEIQNKSVQKTTPVGKDIESFYKYKLFQGNNFTLTVQPKFHYSIYNDFSAYNVDLGLFLLHSKEGKKRTSFQEIGVIARKYWSKEGQSPVGHVIYLLEGYKFKNGFMVSNYTEYEKKKSSNFLYKGTIYEQVSIAKEFYFDSLNVQNFTAQIGYFWKSSIANPMYTISGPIFSLWCDL
tara:strand:+ start:1424 stop:2398 length:975 start_codon:yes stop_codon:yes gene_type:complete